MFLALSLTLYGSTGIETVGIATVGIGTAAYIFHTITYRLAPVVPV